MPVESCTYKGQPAFRWGSTGKCYPYKRGNARSRALARAKAARQGRAIEARKGRSDQTEPAAEDQDELVEAAAPLAQEAKYDEYLQARNQRMFAYFQVRITPVLKSETKQDPQGEDVTDEQVQLSRSTRVGSVNTAIIGIAADWDEKKTVNQQFLGRLATSTAVTSNAKARAIILGAGGTPPDARVFREVVTDETVRAFITNNTELIKTIDSRFFADMQKQVEASFLKGDSVATMTKVIQNRFNVPEYNAMRIARDQVSKLNAALSQSQMRMSGATRYRWLTSQDERVRESHIENNRREFSFDFPPPETGNPGDDVMCRCVAVPVYD